VRRGRGAVGAGDRLGLAVVKIWVVKAAEFGTDLHLFKGIAHVRIAELVELDRFGIVGFDGNQRHPAILVVRRELPDASFIELRGRAMIAGENEDENFASGVVFEAMLLVVDALEAEIRSGRSDSEGRQRRALRGKGRRHKKNQGGGAERYRQSRHGRSGGRDLISA